MPDSRINRFLISLVLFSSLGSCLLWYGTLEPAPELGVTPGTDDVVDDYNQYIGDKVAVDGTVTSTSPLTIRVAKSDGHSIILTVERTDVVVEKGDNLAVYGRLRADNTIVAENTVRKPGDAYIRTRIISLVAGIWVLARALHHWQVDLSRVRVRQIDNPRWRLLFRKTRGDDDA